MTIACYVLTWNCSRTDLQSSYPAKDINACRCLIPSYPNVTQPQESVSFRPEQPGEG